MSYTTAQVWRTGIQGMIVLALLFSGMLTGRVSLQDTAQAAPLLGSPYPSSQVITQVTFDSGSHKRGAPGSDNWPVTWAVDGNQYTSWGDGGGFGGTGEDGRVSLGVARIEGDAGSYRGVNVWGGVNAEASAQFGGKSYGILARGEQLFMWVSPGSDAENYREARLAVSKDRGKTWETADWAFTQADRLVLPTFVQFGPGYSGAQDGYVYIYAIRLQDGDRLQVQKPGQIDLLRVPTNHLFDRQSYQFYAGKDGSGNPVWTSDLKARQAVFSDPAGVGWTVSGTYNAGLGRYLLATEHGESFAGNLGLFDGPTPWGPWTTVLYTESWLGMGQTFFWNFSNKWTSSDGLDFTLVFSGIGENDSWNTVRGRFNSGGTTAPPSTGFSARVNFQPNGSAPSGWLADSGAVYGSRGNGFTYGWNMDNQANTRDRNSSLSPDELHDTLNHLQKDGKEFVWEIAVPNAEYTVRIVSGDPGNTNSVYQVRAEGKQVVGGTPSDANPWVIGTATVLVSDGKLTVASAPGAVNNKINFIEITTLGTSSIPMDLPFKVFLPEFIR